MRHHPRRPAWRGVTPLCCPLVFTDQWSPGMVEPLRLTSQPELCGERGGQVSKAKEGEAECQSKENGGPGLQEVEAGPGRSPSGGPRPPGA